jgi:hypothetical protein
MSKPVMETAKIKVNRKCKQCEAEMDEPLHENGSLWMFCSSHCHRLWDQSARYNKRAQNNVEL